MAADLVRSIEVLDARMASMRHREIRRDPWDRPRDRRVPRVVLWGLGVVAFLVVAVVFVYGIQPASYRLAGRLVTGLGGGSVAAAAVVVAVYAAAALAAGLCWWRWTQQPGTWSTVLVTAASVPVWLFALGLGPVSRDADEGKAQVIGFVDDPALGTALDDGVAVAIGIALVAGLGVAGVRRWWRADRRDFESLRRVEAATRRERQAAERSAASKR